ncbi:hypothetical protein [Pseudomonas sp. EL_65y_Pfl1_R32]
MVVGAGAEQWERQYGSELAKVHGGDVAVSSCAALGTTFTVEFQGT